MKKLTRKCLNDLAEMMPVIEKKEQLEFMGGVNGSIRINGGYLLEFEGGVKYLGDNGSSCFFAGVDLSTGFVTSGAAYQLGGTIHLSESFIASANICDFAHEYGHYIQETQMGGSYYSGVVVPSLWSAATESYSAHMNEPYEVSATNLGDAYLNSNTTYR